MNTDYKMHPKMAAKIADYASRKGRGVGLRRFVRRWWNRISGADRRLATGLVAALSAEKLYKADCFDYLCWLEETDQREKVKDADFLVLASDGTTCWGKTYADAVKVAMHHDKELYDAVCELEANPPNGRDERQCEQPEVHDGK